MTTRDDGVLVYGKCVYPDDLSSMRDEAEMAVKFLITGGDIAYKDRAAAIEEEVRKYVADYQSNPVIG